MNRYSFVVPFVLLASICFSQSKAEITFDTLQHDFGLVQSGDQATHVFTYTNTGTVPVVIKDVRTTCSCTASEYTKDSVAPGEKGSIRVHFDTEGKHGQYVKGINITTNAGESNLLIYIQVEGKQEEIDLENPPSPEDHSHDH